MELLDFQKAESYFVEQIKTEPYRLEGLDSYSTCLWRLKKQVELCQLSNRVLQKYLFSPETWVIVGNSYSAQNEHEAAIRFFKRAIQINPRYSLAFSLCGHELVQIEDIKNAQNFFEKGLSVENNRNYKCFWGIGNIKMKQEKYQEALKYFLQAKQINPNSP